MTTTMPAIETPCLLVNPGRAPDRVTLLERWQDGTARVRFPSGGWLVVAFDDLIVPSGDELGDVAAELDRALAAARREADALSTVERVVLAEFDEFPTSGRSTRELAEQLEGHPAVTGIAFEAARHAGSDDVAPEHLIEALDGVVAGHEHAGRVTRLSYHRRSARGREVTVRRITAHGRLVLLYTNQEAPR